MSDKDNAALVTFGLGGDTVHLKGGGTITGYGSPEKPHAGNDVPDGTLALDKLPALAKDEGVRLAIGGPLVKVDLDPGTVDKLGKASSPMADFMMNDPGNGFGNILRLHNSQVNSKYCALDHVATDIYIGLWRDIGAIVGQMQGGKFQAGAA